MLRPPAGLEDLEPAIKNYSSTHGGTHLHTATRFRQSYPLV